MILKANSTNTSNQNDSRKIFGPSSRAPGPKKHQQTQEMFMFDENQIKVSTTFDPNGTLNNCLNISPTPGSYDFEAPSTSTSTAPHHHHHHQKSAGHHQQSSKHSSSNQHSHQHNYSRHAHDKTLSIVGSILDVPLPSENDAFSEYSTFVNNIFSK